MNRTPCLARPVTADAPAPNPAALGNYWIALLVAVLVLAVLGAALDIVVFRPLQRQDPIVTVLVTFGVLLVLEDFAQTLWGNSFRSMPVPDLLSGAVKIAGEDFPAYRLFMILVAAAVGLGLTLWLRFGRVGLFVALSGRDGINFLNQAKQFGLQGSVFIGGVSITLDSTIKAVDNTPPGLRGARRVVHNQARWTTLRLGVPTTSTVRRVVQ